MDDKRLPPLARIAKAAGKKIKEMRPQIQAEYAAHPQGASGANIDLLEWKPDGSPVTAADKAAHEFICDEIQKDPFLKKIAVLSYMPVLSEEGTPLEMKDALQKKERIETDPLDGTKTYISSEPGNDGYSVNIGHVKDGQAKDGAIYFPEVNGGPGELYYTEGKKAYKQIGDEQPVEIHVRTRPLLHSDAFVQPLMGVSVAPSLIRSEPLTADPNEARLKVAVGYNEQKIGYLGKTDFDAQKAPGQYRTCMVADGRADLTGLNEGLGGSFHTYDIAAAHAVLRAAGGEIVAYNAGNPLASTPVNYKRTDTTDVPSHIAGSIDELVEAGLGTHKSLTPGRPFP